MSQVRPKESGKQSRYFSHAMYKSLNSVSSAQVRFLNLTLQLTMLSHDSQAPPAPVWSVMDVAKELDLGGIAGHYSLHATKCAHFKTRWRFPTNTRPQAPDTTQPATVRQNLRPCLTSSSSVDATRGASWPLVWMIESKSCQLHQITICGRLNSSNLRLTVRLNVRPALRRPEAICRFDHTWHTRDAWPLVKEHARYFESIPTLNGIIMNTLLWLYSDSTLTLLWLYSDSTLTLLWLYSVISIYYWMFRVDSGLGLQIFTHVFVSFCIYAPPTQRHVEHALQCNCVQSQAWPLGQVAVCGQKKPAKARVLVFSHEFVLACKCDMHTLCLVAVILHNLEGAGKIQAWPTCSQRGIPFFSEPWEFWMQTTIPTILPATATHSMTQN